MKWYLLVLVMYAALWGFLGWGVHGDVVSVVSSFSLLLLSWVVVLFNFKNPVIKESLALLMGPSMIVYAIIKSYDSMSTWKIVFIAVATALQIGLWFFYFYFKVKKKKAVNG